MKSGVSWFVTCAVIATVLVSGCENDDDNSKDSSGSTNNASTASTTNAPTDSPGSTANAATELLGLWVGTGQGETVVEVTSYYLGSPGDDYAANCGTLTWVNGDQRQIEDAVYDPPVLKFYLAPMGGEPLPLSHVWNAVDRWELQYHGGVLSGVGTKLSTGRHDGFPIGYYDVSLTRQQ